MIKYIVFNEKVEQCSTREFSSVLRAACSVLRAPCSVLRAPCCVLRASVNQTRECTHLTFRPCCVLRAACKYEMALIVYKIKKVSF